jgi:hypothetical protein
VTKPRARRHAECTPKASSSCALAYQALEPPHFSSPRRHREGHPIRGRHLAGCRADRSLTRPWSIVSMGCCRAPTYRPAANAVPPVARHLRFGAEPQGIDRCGPPASMCTVTHRLARSSRPQCSREWCLHSRSTSARSHVSHCLHLARTGCLRLHGCTLQQETGRGHGEPWCGCRGGHDGGLALQPRGGDGRCGIEHHRRACSCHHRGRRAACGIPRCAALDAVSPESWQLIRLRTGSWRTYPKTLS